MLKYCGVFSWFWFMTATILVVICPNYLKEFSQIVILQRHLLWVKTKCNYTLLYGITPEFKQKLIFDINSSPFYSVTFDKSMNSEFQMYQIDVGIQFQNNNRGLVETCCQDSQFLRHPNAKNVLSCLTDSISHLDSDKLLQLTMDGFNVNWLVLGMLDDKLEADNFARTLHIGSCAQRIIHGALKEGIHKTVWNLCKLLKSLFQLFNNSPARQEACLVGGDTDKFHTRFALLF